MKPTPPTQVIPNTAVHLRLVAVLIDARGHTVSVEQPIIGWALAAGHALPVPITPGAHPEGASLFVFDSLQKTWTDDEGCPYSDWKQITGPLYAQWSHDNPKGTPKPAPPSLRAVDPDVWGVGQEPKPPTPPKPWKPAK